MVSHLWRFMWICVCGKYYLLVQYKYEPFQVFTKEEFPTLYKNLITDTNSVTRRFLDYKYSDFVDRFDSNLVEIHKQLKQPVFLVDQYRNIIDRVPRLGDYDYFTKNFIPEQMWQNIYSFISNVIRENPDTKPPVEISNNDKIHKAGFDIKTSFRKSKLT